jgi:hypothetical protein
MSHALYDCLADVEARMQSTGLQIFVIATATETSKIPPVLISRFTNEIVLKVGSVFSVHTAFPYTSLCTSYRLRLKQNDRA